MGTKETSGKKGSETSLALLQSQDNNGPSENWRRQVKAPDSGSSWGSSVEGAHGVAVEKSGSPYLFSHDNLMWTSWGSGPARRPFHSGCRHLEEMKLLQGRTEGLYTTVVANYSQGLLICHLPRVPMQDTHGCRGRRDFLSWPQLCTANPFHTRPSATAPIRSFGKLT